MMLAAKIVGMFLGIFVVAVGSKLLDYPINFNDVVIIFGWFGMYLQMHENGELLDDIKNELKSIDRTLNSINLKD
jgi:hypothetical protein